MGQEPHGIDDIQKDGQPPGEGVDPAEAVHRLEERAQAIRGNLDVLVDEVERRGSRLVKPLVIGAGAAAAAALVIGGVAVWRSLRRPPPSRLRGLGRALRRIAENPDRVAEQRPSLSKRVIGSVVATVASVAIHQLVGVATAKLARKNAAPSSEAAPGGVTTLERDAPGVGSR
jgi:hypothetical protein